MLTDKANAAQFICVVQPVFTLHWGISTEHVPVFLEILKAIHLHGEMVRAVVTEHNKGSYSLLENNNEGSESLNKATPDATRLGNA